ncbi:hypothetical protein, partial [Pseudolactococcus chungangensis]
GYNETCLSFSFVLLSNSHYRRKDFFMQKNRLGNFPTRFIIEPMLLTSIISISDKQKSDVKI